MSGDKLEQAKNAAMAHLVAQALPCGGFNGDGTAGALGGEVAATRAIIGALVALSGIVLSNLFNDAGLPAWLAAILTVLIGGLIALLLTATHLDALTGADALFIATEANRFRAPAIAEFKARMNAPNGGSMKAEACVLIDVVRSAERSPVSGNGGQSNPSAMTASKSTAPLLGHQR